MNLTVSIEVDSRIPHYEQLRAQLAALITSGRLVDGSRLPTVRVLANDLGIASGTVARAYRDLEAAGLVTSVRRRGTLVTAPASTLERSVLDDAARAFVQLASAHGLSGPQVHDLVTAALAEARTEPEAATVGTAPAPV